MAQKHETARDDQRHNLPFCILTAPYPLQSTQTTTIKQQGFSTDTDRTGSSNSSGDRRQVQIVLFFIYPLPNFTFAIQLRTTKTTMSSTKLGSAGDVELLIIAVVALSFSSRPINVFKVRNPIAKDISSLSKTNIYSSNIFHNPNF
jgi:hypothetical protein